jgi:hypothetical protein
LFDERIDNDRDNLFRHLARDRRSWRLAGLGAEVFMSEPNFTPGPLNVSKLGTPDYAPEYGIYEEGDPRDLARVIGPNSKANAQLFSAAPDLFDAVNHVLIASEDSGTFNDVDFALLRAAIAKARGE